MLLFQMQEDQQRVALKYPGFDEEKMALRLEFLTSQWKLIRKDLAAKCVRAPLLFLSCSSPSFVHSF